MCVGWFRLCVPRKMRRRSGFSAKALHVLPCDLAERRPGRRARGATRATARGRPCESATRPRSPFRAVPAPRDGMPSAAHWWRSATRRCSSMQRSRGSGGRCTSRRSRCVKGTQTPSAVLGASATAAQRGSWPARRMITARPRARPGVGARDDALRRVLVRRRAARHPGAQHERRALFEHVGRGRLAGVDNSSALLHRSHLHRRRPRRSDDGVLEILADNSYRVWNSEGGRPSRCAARATCAARRSPAPSAAAASPRRAARARPELPRTPSPDGPYLVELDRREELLPDDPRARGRHGLARAGDVARAAALLRRRRRRPPRRRRRAVRVGADARAGAPPRAAPAASASRSTACGRACARRAARRARAPRRRRAPRSF